MGDGGMTFALEKRGYVKAGLWIPKCTVDHPEAGLLFKVESISLTSVTVKVMLHETIFNDDFSRRFLMHVTRDNF